jgi:hypothetical protein
MPHGLRLAGQARNKKPGGNGSLEAVQAFADDMRHACQQRDAAGQTCLFWRCKVNMFCLKPSKWIKRAFPGSLPSPSTVIKVGATQPAARRGQQKTRRKHSAGLDRFNRFTLPAIRRN